MTALPPSPFIFNSAASDAAGGYDRRTSAPLPPVATVGPIAESSTSTGGHQEAPAAAANPDTAGATDCIPELLARLNAGHPVDLDALAANIDKIDRNSAPPDRELLTFLQGEPPIYWPSRPRPTFLQALFD